MIADVEDMGMRFERNLVASQNRYIRNRAPLLS